MELNLRKLSFSYDGNLKILDNVSIKIKSGQTTALVGPSGSGKTTLVHLLLRFYDCSPNSIYIDKTDISKFELESLRAKIALVSQDTQLFNDTLRNNICYGVDKDYDEKDLTRVLEQAKLTDFVESLPKKLETEVGDRGVQLSGGQKQRVSIARAILRAPEILILDEATSALDSSTEKLVQEAIDQLVVNKTVIVIAHRFSTLKNADQIITLDKGKVTEVGALSELLDKGGAFAKLWQDQEMFH